MSKMMLLIVLALALPLSYADQYDNNTYELLIVLALALPLSYADQYDNNTYELQEELRNPQKHGFNNRVDLLNDRLRKWSDNFDINAKGIQGRTLLMDSVLSGYSDVVAVLLENTKLNVLVPEKDGYTPLHGAAFQGRATIAKMLLDHGVEDHLKHHKDGYLPIHRATWGRTQRHTDTVKVFLDNGTPPYVLSAKKETLLDTARGNAETLKLVKEYMEKEERRKDL